MEISYLSLYSLALTIYLWILYFVFRLIIVITDHLTIYAASLFANQFCTKLDNFDTAFNKHLPTDNIYYIVWILDCKLYI